MSLDWLHRRAFLSQQTSIRFAPSAIDPNEPVATDFFRVLKMQPWRDYPVVEPNRNQQDEAVAYCKSDRSKHTVGNDGAPRSRSPIFVYPEPEIARQEVTPSETPIDREI